MNQMVQPKGQVRIYACGGGGLNIGLQLEKHRGVAESGFANCSITYIDTSRSNMRSGMEAAHTYLLDGLDGSGKVRSENHAVIDRHIASILETFAPLDLNIVLHTAAGGSGSVIGPLLTSAMLAKDVPVLVMAIGSADTRLDAENTLKTLKSYEAIAHMRKAPVVMFYHQNGAGVTRESVDSRIKEVAMALAMLFSREHSELDSKDLRNFLRFSEKVTSFAPQLTALSLVEKTNDLSALNLGNVIAVATLANQGEATSITPLPEYQCAGFLPEAVVKDVHTRMPMHFVLSDAVLTGVATRLNELLVQIDTAKATRHNSKGVLSATDSAVDSGLVL